jgi:hypothetical protein
MVSEDEENFKDLRLGDKYFSSPDNRISAHRSGNMIRTKSKTKKSKKRPKQIKSAWVDEESIRRGIKSKHNNLYRP